jgi:hypothetical protein
MENNNLSQKAFQQNANEYVDRAVVSALHVLPHVFGLVKPKSIVDIGCGGAAWLSACGALGVEDILGIDGDYVELGKLKIPKQKFQAHDLRQRLVIDRKFDLAMSLEVAEHIPQAYAETLIDSLVRLSPVVLFSGALPFQGGVGHVNEQWPTYWKERFSRQGYQVVDCIRKRVWDNDKVDTWYKNNIMLFVESGYLKSHDTLLREARIGDGFPLNFVHPDRYIEEADPKNIDFRNIPLDTAWAALKLQARKKIRSKLHWRLQRFI